MTSMAHPSQSDIGDISDFVTSTKVTITDVVLALVVLIAAWMHRPLGQAWRSHGARPRQRDQRGPTPAHGAGHVLLPPAHRRRRRVDVRRRGDPADSDGRDPRSASSPSSPSAASPRTSQPGSSCRPVGRSSSATTSTCSNTPASSARSTAEPSSSRRGTAGGSTSPTTRSSTTHSSTTPSTTHGAPRSRSAWPSATSFDEAVAAVVETVANVPGVSPITDPRSSSAASIRDGW